MESRYLTLICEAEKWEEKGMYEVADLYYAEANKIAEEIEIEYMEL